MSAMFSLLKFLFRLIHEDRGGKITASFHEVSAILAHYDNKEEYRGRCNGSIG